MREVELHVAVTQRLVLAARALRENDTHMSGASEPLYYLVGRLSGVERGSIARCELLSILD